VLFIIAIPGRGKVTASLPPGGRDLDAVVDPINPWHISQNGLEDLFQIERGKLATTRVPSEKSREMVSV
jgi:hypothetical protein